MSTASKAHIIVMSQIEGHLIKRREVLSGYTKQLLRYVSEFSDQHGGIRDI